MYHSSQFIDNISALSSQIFLDFLMKFPASYTIVAICSDREDAPGSALIKGRAAVLNRLVAAAVACITAVESAVGRCQFLLWLDLMDEEEARGRGVDGDRVVQMESDGARFDMGAFVLMGGSVGSGVFSRRWRNRVVILFFFFFFMGLATAARSLRFGLSMK